MSPWVHLPLPPICYASLHVAVMVMVRNEARFLGITFVYTRTTLSWDVCVCVCLCVKCTQVLLQTTEMWEIGGGVPFDVQWYALLGCI